MRAFIVAAVILLTGVGTEQGMAQVNFGVSVGDRDGFYFEISNYYRVPQRQVILIHDRRIDDDEIPVVFFMADAAGVRPEVIADMRRDGWSWREIAFHFRLDPQIFYVPVYGIAGPYGAFHSYRDWRRIGWRDNDFIRFANVKFLSEHYRWHPDQIMHMRAQKRNFYFIHNDIRREVYRRNPPARGGHGNWDNNGKHNGWKQKEYRKQKEYNRDDQRNTNDDRRNAPRNNDSRVRRHGSERE